MLLGTFPPLPHTPMQDLVDQPQHHPPLGIDGQAVVAQEAAAVAVAKEAKVMDRFQTGIVQFGAVVEDEDGAGRCGHMLPGQVVVRLQDTSVFGLGPVDQIAKRLVILGSGELIGQRTAGMASQAVRQADQTGIAGLVPKVNTAEVLFAKAEEITGDRIHHDSSQKTTGKGQISPKVSAGGQAGRIAFVKITHGLGHVGAPGGRRQHQQWCLVNHTKSGVHLVFATAGLKFGRNLKG